jgi:prepilin-type N-terminal cleavage/methylation domain-containing protein
MDGPLTSPKFITPMKTRPATLRAQFAFTLIELITVIAIIAILMALLFPAMTGAREGARRGKAGTVVRSIVNACKSYSTDYGKYPPVEEARDGGGGSGSDATLSFGDQQGGGCRANNNELFDVLRAINRGANSEHALNKRQQKYFEESKATDPKNPRDGFCDGKEFEGDLQGRLMDPWGTQYCVVLDADGDETIKMGTFYTDQTDPIRFSAVAFALAKDGKRGGKGYEGKLRKEKSNEPPDDIVSWQ